MTVVWGGALSVGAGVALVVLGLWALTLKPRRVTTLAFAAYTAGLGAFVAIFFASLAWPDVPWLPAGAGASLATQLVTPLVWAALIIFVLGVPRPLRRDEMRLLVRPLVLTSAFLAIAFALPRAVLLGQYAVNVGNWAATFFSIGVAWERFRAADGPNAPLERRNVALIAVALILIVGEATGRIGIESVQFPAKLAGTGLVPGSLLALLALAGAWLAAASHAQDGTSRDARNVVLVGLGAWVFGGAWQAWAGHDAPYLGSFGVAVLAGGVLLARGALVGNLLGADVQLRWGISKSTIAAVFIAVFFVASETAQQFFGETLGSTYVGIAAAGALVFAMAPLQRAAERLAERAVPVAPADVAAPRARSEKEQSYKRALRIALRDKRLTREEDIHLHELAEHLGIGAGRAMTLRVEVERELADATRGVA